MPLAHTVMHQLFKASTPPSPPPSPGNLRAFDCHWCAGGGEFEPCLAGVGNLNQKCQLYPWNTSVKCLNMEVLKVKSLLLLVIGSEKKYL